MHRCLLALLTIAGCWTGDEPPPQTPAPRLERPPVRATPPIAAKPMTPPHVGDPAAGRQLYDQQACVQCHTIDGSVRIGPSWKGIWGGQVMLEDGRTIAIDEAYVRRSILEPQADIVIGFPRVMPAFRGQLTDDQLADLVAFIASLKR